MASPRTPSSGEPDKPSQQAHSSCKFSFAKHLLPALGYDSAVPVLPSVCSDPSVCSNSVTAGSSHKCDAAEGQRCYDISRLVLSVCTASCSLSAAPASLANAKESCWSGVDRCQVCLQPINDLRGSNHLGTLLTLCLQQQATKGLSWQCTGSTSVHGAATSPLTSIVKRRVMIMSSTADDISRSYVWHL